MTWLAVLGAMALNGAAQTAVQTLPPPIIDMHMHAWSLQEFGGKPPPGCMGARGIDMHGVDPAKPFDFMAQATCKVMVDAPKTDKALLDDTIAQMRRFNIVSGVISGERAIVAKWKAAAPDRFVTAENFFDGPGLPPASRAAALEQQVKSGETKVFAEVTRNIAGCRPTTLACSPSMPWRKSSTFRSAFTWVTERPADLIGSIRNIAPLSAIQCCSKRC